jgi:PAS domain S-box-containing protein
LQDLTRTKKYNKRLVERLEQKNIELLVQTTALETAANAVTITDGKGVILWVNRAFSILNGYTPEEIIGKSPHMLKSGLHDRAFYRDLWDTILSGKTWHGAFTNRRKDGSLYYGEQTITPVCQGGGTITHFIGIMIDVTARKKADEELSLFRALIDRSSDGIEVLDPETRRYLDINETTCKRLGYSREEMLSMSLTDIEIAADNIFAWPEFLEEIRQTGFKFFEGRQRRKDGSTFPVEVNIRYIRLDRDYLVAAVRDVTERKQATAQIEEQAALLDKAQDAIVVCDLEGRIFFWNKGAERMYGWKRREVWGRDVSSLINTNGAKEEEAHDAVLKDGEWSGELQKTTKNGHKLAVEARWTLLRDKGEPQNPSSRSPRTSRSGRRSRRNSCAPSAWRASARSRAALRMI